MKILQLSKYYPPTFGGLELVAEFISRAAKDLGHKVSVSSVGKTNLQYTGRYSESVHQSREDIRLKSAPLSMGYYKSVFNSLRNDPPEYIFVHLPNPFAHEVLKLCHHIIKEKKIKVIGVYHSDIVNQVHLRDAYNFYFSRHLHLYDSFICSSKDLKKSSAVLSALPNSKVGIIPFCVENTFQQKLTKRSHHFRGRFLTVGRMVPYKGYRFLVDSFKTLPYSLTIVGGGPLLNELKANAAPNVNFVGEVSEEKKYELFSEHDALIVSSINRAEAYGMTIVEAFSVGLPVITSDIDTGVSFLVKEGITGLKFPIMDTTKLHAQIERLASVDEFRHGLSNAGIDFYRKELNYDAFKENMRNYLKSV